MQGRKVFFFFIPHTAEWNYRKIQNHGEKVERPVNFSEQKDVHLKSHKICSFQGKKIKLLEKRFNIWILKCHCRALEFQKNRCLLIFFLV